MQITSEGSISCACYSWIEDRGGVNATFGWESEYCLGFWELSLGMTATVWSERNSGVSLVWITMQCTRVDNAMSHVRRSQNCTAP